MAYDKLVDSAKLDGALKSTADAIRSKTGSTENIPWSETEGFKSAVEGITAGGGSGGSTSGDGSPVVFENVVNIWAEVSVTAEDILFDDEGVSCWFDCREGVTSTAWENQYGDNDFELYNPVITDEYVEVVGSATSYGKLTHGGAAGTEVTTQSYMTRYYVFKNLGGKYSNWRTIVGNEASTNCCSSISMDANGVLRFARGYVYFEDYHCSDWHVVAIRSTLGGDSDIWCDGVFVGSGDNCNGWAADTYLARGSTWNYSDNNTAFRAIVIADVAHTDDQIVYNSEWLKERFIDYFVSA